MCILCTFYTNLVKSMFSNVFLYMFNVFLYIFNDFLMIFNDFFWFSMILLCFCIIFNDFQCFQDLSNLDLGSPSWKKLVFNKNFKKGCLSFWQPDFFWNLVPQQADLRFSRIFHDLLRTSFFERGKSSLLLSKSSAGDFPGELFLGILNDFKGF